MHVGDEQVGPSVVVVIEELDAHAPQDVRGKNCSGLVDEPPAALVLEVVIRSLHVEREEVGEAVAVQIRDARIAAPAGVAETASAVTSLNRLRPRFL